MRLPTLVIALAALAAPVLAQGLPPEEYAERRRQLENAWANAETVEEKDRLHREFEALELQMSGGEAAIVEEEEDGILEGLLAGLAAFGEWFASEAAGAGLGAGGAEVPAGAADAPEDRLGELVGHSRLELFRVSSEDAFKYPGWSPAAVEAWSEARAEVEFWLAEATKSTPRNFDDADLAMWSAALVRLGSGRSSLFSSKAVWYRDQIGATRDEMSRLTARLRRLQASHVALLPVLAHSEAMKDGVSLFLAIQDWYERVDNAVGFLSEWFWEGGKSAMSQLGANAIDQLLNELDPVGDTIETLVERIADHLVDVVVTIEGLKNGFTSLEDLLDQIGSTAEDLDGQLEILQAQLREYRRARDAASAEYWTGG